MTALDHRRRSNLAIVLRELDWSGVEGLKGKAHTLGTTSKILRAIILDRQSMPESLARDIEWIVHKPAGWMDEDHDGDPLR